MRQLLPRSGVTGALWPAVPGPAAARLLAIQQQLEQSQWWPPERLLAQQLRQLRILLQHAADTVPFYSERLADFRLDPRLPLDPERFSRIPVLGRAQVQEAGERLLSRAVPQAHGQVGETRTAGSTGHPVRVKTTEVSWVFWLAFTLRDNLWQGRDLGAKLATIRSKVEDGPLPGWGPALDLAYATGPAALLNIAADPARQLDWLREQGSGYLMTHPTNLRELLWLARERGVKLPGLREVVTFGEMLHPGLRALCREAWGVPVKDLYSAEEVGYIAFQCPEHEHYHVQAEGLLLEVLDEAGRPCAPGETGRVVVTPLHNFAMPLIRYELGDYAEAGSDCPCGRGLPVLKRILGRQRNMVVLPDGSRHWPSLPAEVLELPVRRRRVVQRTLEEIEFSMEVTRPLTAEEERRLVSALQKSLGHPFRITLRRVERLDDLAPAGHKHEDFVSLVSGKPPA